LLLKGLDRKLFQIQPAQEKPSILWARLHELLSCLVLGFGTSLTLGQARRTICIDFIFVTGIGDEGSMLYPPILGLKRRIANDKLAFMPVAA
jgi:hypothetical protein